MVNALRVLAGREGDGVKSWAVNLPNWEDTQTGIEPGMRKIAAHKGESKKIRE